MERDARQERLQIELKGLEVLDRNSSLFSVIAEGDPPNKFCVKFLGKGIVRLNDVNAEAEFSSEHEIQIQIPYLFPKQEPDLKWLTPILHPNVSKSGFVDLRDIGLEWTPELSLEIICERLWDTIRFAFVDWNSATNLEVKKWFEDHSTLRLPIDARPLRDREFVSLTNVVQYSPRDKKRSLAPRSTRDVLFIGDEAVDEEIQATDTAIDSTEKKQSAPSTTRPTGDDEVLFID